MSDTAVRFRNSSHHGDVIGSRLSGQMYAENIMTVDSNFCSPAQTLYGSPVSERQDAACHETDCSSSHEIAYPRAKLLLKEEEISLLQGTEYTRDSDLGLPALDRQSIQYRWDKLNERAVPSSALLEDSLQQNNKINGLATHTTAVYTKSGTSKQAPKVLKVSRAPRNRKASADKPEKPKVPKLTKPLSELTKDYHHLPFKNMENWVHRSAEVRWAEVDKRGGYVTRPMNSFMLYRSAYAERTKFWCLQNNHQVVSSVSGESWPLEPPQIREKYNELAKIERVNHQAAHPGYKFSPSKAQSGRKRKDSKVNEEDSAISDLDDSLDLIDTTGGHRSKKNTRSKKSSSGMNGVPNPLLYVGFTYDKPTGGPLRSSFNHNNPGKTPPQCIGTTDMLGHYYETTVRASSTTPIPNPMPIAVIEDVTIRKTQGPSHSLDIQHCHNSLLHNESLQLNGYSPNSDTIKLESEDNSKVDPLLLTRSMRDSRSYMDRSPSQEQNNVLRQFLPESSCDINVYELDPLFGGSPGGAYLEVPYVENGQTREPLIHFDNTLLESGIDVHKLPGYTDNMEGFLDNQEPWCVTEDVATPHDEEKLCYDEWLQS
ncbi:hypothetical protein EDC01DRAFT_636491 [Geopyxis carbonaria]|nr:hypothetical protein EDC01DRAFT_636491 [Geopyxis carbonaria]